MKWVYDIAGTDGKGNLWRAEGTITPDEPGIGHATGEALKAAFSKVMLHGRDCGGPFHVHKLWVEELDDGS